MILALAFLKWGATSCLTGNGGHRGHAMCHEERSSLTLTFGKGIKLICLMDVKWRPTSCLTGSGGHRGHTMCHEERSSLTLTFGKGIKFISLTDVKWGATSCLTGSRGHRGHTMCHKKLIFPNLDIRQRNQVYISNGWFVIDFSI